jgi:hypothetical protein
LKVFDQQFLFDFQHFNGHGSLRAQSRFMKFCEKSFFLNKIVAWTLVFAHPILQFQIRQFLIALSILQRRTTFNHLGIKIPADQATVS